MKRVIRQNLLPLMPARLRHWLIAQNRQPLFANFRKAGLVYVHVPRTGGTSVSETVFDSWIDHFTLREQLATLPADLLAMPRFTVVRNPWERALSSWSFASAGTGHDARIYVENRHLYRVPEFRTFERFVLDWLPAQDPRKLDPLFRPQTHFLLDDAASLPYDHIGRLEQLSATEGWLNRQLGKSIQFPHYNRSVHGQYRECYSTEMRDKIGQIYAEDIAHLGYAF